MRYTGFFPSYLFLLPAPCSLLPKTYNFVLTQLKTAIVDHKCRERHSTELGRKPR
ncbi:hypothetical protein [Moorena sp. SIO3H5]|uniref:hypothetical protein n=1 Tax=Moorena sp. SIO3H5 TaxID=2607834 RepID=UPI0013BD0EFD|nr:hypothetical protein [Moorena sp. SIO3H5]NEO69565.1 hypothetical protein [Moorena sp. SIO3H5]